MSLQFASSINEQDKLTHKHSHDKILRDKTNNKVNFVLKGRFKGFCI